METILQPANIDTYIDVVNPTTNYGSSGYLYVGTITNGSNWKHSLLKFNGLSDGTIPSNATVTSAVISFYLLTENSNYDRTLYLNRCLRAWTEAGATWNQYSSGNNWQTAGALGANDIDSTWLGSRAISSAEGVNAWKDITLDNTTIQQMIQGILPNNGFKFTLSGGWADEYIFASSNYGTSNLRPKLTINYFVPQIKFYRRTRIAGNINGL